jgi:hypothetical protein
MFVAPLRSKVAITALLIICAAIYGIVGSAGFGACVQGSITESLKETVKALDSTVDLGIKLSTTLVGLAAALLIGLKTGVRLTPTLRLLLFLCIILFTQSALYAVWWRLGIAEIWMNECLNLLAEPRILYRYWAHYYFMLAGLLSFGVLVSAAAFAAPSRAMN